MRIYRMFAETLKMQVELLSHEKARKAAAKILMKSIELMKKRLIF